jgi:hypothetical protein
MNNKVDHTSSKNIVDFSKVAMDILPTPFDGIMSKWNARQKYYPKESPASWMIMDHINDLQEMMYEHHVATPYGDVYGNSAALAYVKELIDNDTDLGNNYGFFTKNKKIESENFSAQHICAENSRAIKQIESKQQLIKINYLIAVVEGFKDHLRSCANAAGTLGFWSMYDVDFGDDRTALEKLRDDKLFDLEVLNVLSSNFNNLGYNFTKVKRSEFINLIVHVDYTVNCE